MSTNQGINLGNNKIMIDDEGSIFVSRYDSVRDSVTWNKVPSNSNEVLESTILGNSTNHESISGFKDKTSKNKEINANEAYSNDGSTHTETGILKPASITAELASTSYTYLSKDDSSYVSIRSNAIVGKIPQVLIKLDLISLIEKVYGNLWSVYGAENISSNPNNPTYNKLDKVKIVRSIVGETTHSTKCRGTGTCYSKVLISGNYSSSNVSSHDGSGTKFLNLKLSSDTSKQAVDEDGCINYLIHGVAATSSIDQTMELYYDVFYTKFNIRMNDIYMSKYQLNEEIANKNVPSVTISDTDIPESSIKDSNYHVVFSPID